MSFRNVGLLNGAWVALAPLLLLPLAWLGLIHILLPLWMGAVGMVAACRLFDRHRPLRRAALNPGHQARRAFTAPLRNGGRTLVVGLYLRVTRRNPANSKSR